MNVLQLIGRIVFGGFFIFNGLNHFMSTGMLAQYAGSKGVPAPEVAVILTGILLVLAGLSVLVGYRPALGLWALVIFLIPTAIIMHDFWAVPEAQATAQMSQFMKNFALAGASLMLLWAADLPWPYSVGGSSAGGEVG